MASAKRRKGVSGVKIDGLNALLTKLRSENLYGQPWRRMMERLGDLGEQKAKSRAPVKSGRLKASITHSVQAVPVPLWVKVTANAESNGARYPFILNAGRRRGKAGDVLLHFAGRKKTTRNWFSGVLAMVRQVAKTEMPRVASEIEAAWKQ